MMDQKLKILHLEDVHSDAFLIRHAIKKGNINSEIRVVDTKDKFINALKESTPDIILSDHSLPSFNSIEALAILEKTGLKIPFILITGAVDEFAVDIIRQGADDYVLKDRLQLLPTAIHNSLEKFQLEKERERMIYEHAHLGAIVNASNDGIISKTLAGTITSWNKGAEKLFWLFGSRDYWQNITLVIPPDHYRKNLKC